MSKGKYTSVHTHSQASLHIFPGFTHIKYQFSSSVHTDPPKRGPIKEFSDKSRKNFIKALLSLERSPVHMVTLTYPDRYPGPQEAKNHLHHFAVRLMLTFPKAWFYWKLEPQRRGAPHFHLLGDFADDMPPAALRSWVSAVWFQVVGSKDLRHLRAGTRVDVIQGHRHLVRYLTKYVSKPQGHANWESPGRFWGKIGTSNIPVSQGVHFTLGRREVIQLRRLIRRWLKRWTSRFSRIFAKLSSVTVYIPAQLVEQFLRWVTQEPVALEGIT